MNDLSKLRARSNQSSGTSSTVSLDSVNINGSVNTLNSQHTPAHTAIDIELDEDELSDLLTLVNVRKGSGQHRPKMHMRTLPAIQPEVREEQEVTDESPLFQSCDSAEKC